MRKKDEEGSFEYESPCAVQEKMSLMNTGSACSKGNWVSKALSVPVSDE